MDTLKRQSYRRIIFTPWLFGLLLSLVGCEYYTDYSAFLSEPDALVSATDYRIAPPDQIMIHSKLVRELNGYSELIRPDGKITLPLLGSVFITGMTCEEASMVLEDMAQDYYEGADVSLRVTGYNSKKVFVFGEVAGPGPYRYNGGNTILATLAAAQPTRLADPGRIHVLRPNRDGDLINRMTIDLDRMVKTGDVGLNAVLEEGDIIYVPANAFAAVGLAFQQLLLPIQPAAATVRGPASIEETAVGTTYGREDR